MEKIQPEQGSSKSTRPKRRKVPSGFTPVPHSLSRDSTLSDSAFRLWVVLEGSQGSHSQSQLKRETLAADMGKSVSAIGRALKELTAAGLLETVRTRGASFYKITHPDLVKKGHKRPTRKVINDPYIEQEVSKEINTSKQVPALTTERLKVPAAAAQTVELEKAFPDTDPFEVLAYTEALPKYLQPKRNKLVPQHVHEAIRHGWTAIELAKAVEKAGNYQTATNPPGLAIIKLGELAAMSPSEWNTDRQPQPYDPINECKHGVLKIYGGCENCAEERQANSRKISA